MLGNKTPIASIPQQMQMNLPPMMVSAALILLTTMVLQIPGQDAVEVIVYLAFLYCTAWIVYRRLLRPVDASFTATLFILCILAKLLGSMVRYWTVVDLYGGSADALGYHRQGAYLAEYFRAMDLSVLDGYRYKGEGTTWMAIFTGIVYVFFPPSLPGSFLFFSTLALVGSTLFYMVHRRLFPDESPLWYLYFVFFAPSVLFWPSSLGKDAWIYFATGLVAWGWLRYTQGGGLSNFVWIVIGLGCIAPIRAPVAALLSMGIGLSYLLRLYGGALSPLRLAIGSIAILLLAGSTIQMGAGFLGLEDLSIDAVSTEYEQLRSREYSGGSSFRPPNVLNPVGAVYGVFTILFRPFPFEAHNVQTLVTSLESLGWLALLWLRRKVLWKRLRSIPKKPFLAFALFYVVTMAMALTTGGNFGIVARQRLMFLPLFWMLFA